MILNKLGILTVSKVTCVCMHYSQGESLKDRAKHSRLVKSDVMKAGLTFERLTNDNARVRCVLIFIIMCF